MVANAKQKTGLARAGTGLGKWKPFPFRATDYDYSDAALKKQWRRLHQGDCEPYPDAAALKKLVALHPRLGPSVPLDAAAATLRAAWQAFHRGDFGAAIDAGLGLGLLGYNIANKSTAIYATYLETSETAKQALYLQAAERAKVLCGKAKSLANAWYLHALALGRYAQSISVAAALAQGIGGKVKASLERTLALAPSHADAHIALGAYHAEVINKVGALLGGLTYGASKEAAQRHFHTALKLNPHSAIARIEYANGLVMMYGRERMDEATRLYREAAACPPADAMERFDAELAKADLAS